ncbi:glycosyltransferase family 2 protein [Pelomonas sp. SE-A7]|uniref:glycosyltransferase family 2 protein n=1 Tax=Pelomonas sp. SE-A7 TaxID=3054953 RepID=UPI00259C8EBE|nr:glycosyltransferase family 2 protein [Pelomonas sp. SE-A7]MDM4767532.1 glycosyltransferase family 2 protein [Pelomonas sp. SE-A7]
MSQLPLVSIVTPAYNQADYLRATIESVLAQDYPALEYLVIDDGSGDATLAIAEGLAREHPGRLRVLTQANAGQAATLNRGWSLAQGQILAYLSSDDCLCPGAVSAMVAALNAHPEVAVAYCDFWLMDAAGRRLRPVQAAEFDAEQLRVELVCQPGPGAFFRRRVFEATGGWDVRRRQVPDFEFWLRASAEGAFLRVPQCLADYRIHEGSASFMVMPEARADEIVRVVEGFWESAPDAGSASRATARALSIAAKNHAQSGRPLLALGRLAQAFQRRPGLALEPAIWRQLLVGFTRRAYYGARRVLRGVAA